MRSQLEEGVSGARPDRRRITIRMALAGTIVLVCVGSVALGRDPASPLALLRGVFEELSRSHPAVFFGVMSVVCVFPVPVSLFYVASAALFGTAASLGWISVALVINMTIAHSAASSLLRPAIARLLEARAMKIPEASGRSDELLLILLVRITPGIPFFAQNLLLGLADVDLLRALVVSLPIQMIFATGFVVLGQSAFDGDLGMAVLAVGLIGSASIAARLLHRRFGRRLA
jgi:uncharacterized membrane protein YdjX (TVP38/TMEM64 family)